MSISGFCDLNILCDNSESIPPLEVWFKNHYCTVAVNHVIDLTETTEQKKKKKGEKNDVIIPEPRDVKLPLDLPKKVNVLNRLTIKISDLSQFPKVGKSASLKKYDIIAVMPTEQSCLQQACSMSDVDVISVDCQSKPTWKLTKKIYKSALEQNKFFEMCYGPSLRDSSTLKNLVYVAHIFYTVGKSKNLIFSSGISDTFLVRSPYEVIHLCFIFGLEENEARKSITSTPADLVNRAVKRRRGKTCISLTPS